MTVSTTDRKIIHEADGNVKIFPFYFKVVDEDDVKVYFRDTDNTEVEQTTGFTKSLNEGNVGGDITFTTAPTDDYLVIIIREVTVTQETDYVEGSNLRADTLEDDFDKGIMLDQQHSEEIERCLKYPISDTATSAEIPNETERASKYLAFDSDGNPIASVGTATVPYTTYGATIIQSENVDEAQDVLNVVPGTDVQAYNANLSDIADIDENGILFYFNNGITYFALNAVNTGLLNASTTADARTAIIAAGNEVYNYWHKQQLYSNNSLTCVDGTTVWDVNSKAVTTLELDYSTTLTISGTLNGYADYRLYVKNVGESNNITWDSDILWSDDIEPTLTTTSGAVDMFNFSYNPVTGKFYGSYSLNYS